MPGWSPEIAKEFVRLGEQDGVAFTQGKLQKLVYIAHGWCLANTGEPLTGDRPEAWAHGPVYRRLADALVACGLDEVHAEQLEHSVHSTCSELDLVEQAIILKVYRDYGRCDAASLATLTRHGDAPWGGVFNGGAGKDRDISHQLVRKQFVRLSQEHGSGDRNR